MLDTVKEAEQAEMPDSSQHLHTVSLHSSTKEVENGGDARQSDDMEDGEPTGRRYPLEGWRFMLTLIALCIACFVSTLETTIVSTSLVSITNALAGLEKSSWIVTSYLVTYTASLIIFAKLSDIFGRKVVFVVSICLFTLFSIACGLSQTLTQLIILRAFQGIGGGATYSMIWVIGQEMAPVEAYAKYSAILSSMFTLSTLLGPLFGGFINDSASEWRWIFLLNAPGGAVILFLVLVALPWNFPRPLSEKFNLKGTLTLANLKRIDFLGNTLLLAATVLFITALEEGGTEYSWKSAIVLALFLISMILWPCFFGWERYTTKRLTSIEPILPWRIVAESQPLGTLLQSFFSGAAFLAVTINLPQRFQVLNGLSPIQAAYRFLALTLCGPIAAGAAGSLTAKLKVPPFYILLAGSSLQLLGIGLATTASSSVGDISPALYGYQVIMGIGFGFSISVVLLMAPLVFLEKDLAVGMGAINQFRYLGGIVCLAVCTNVLNDRLTQKLSTVLSPSDLSDIIQSISAIEQLPLAIQIQARNVYGEGYQTQLYAILGFAAAGLLSTSLLWEKKLRRFA